MLTWFGRESSRFGATRSFWTDDLAAVYGVETGALNRAVKRNAHRFPPDFIFRLTKGGVAVVGSRHINGEAESFARAVGRSSAQAGMQLVSGAARGVDETAMHGAFEEGGPVIGVMADSLLRAAVSGKYREAAYSQCIGQAEKAR